MNKFQFLGRLTKDPEIRVAPATGNQVTSFSVAVNRRFASPNGERQTDFFNLTAFGKTGEFCSKYFKKGQQVLVEGRIQNRTWDDPTGAKRYFTDFIVEQAYFADSRRDDQSGSAMPAQDMGFDMSASTAGGDFITVDETEELPF